MEIKGNKIIFRSRPHFYEKEESGRKCNTVRQLTIQEVYEINKWICGEGNDIIRIENLDTGAFFERTITDISCFDNHHIFSWEHAA